MRSHLDRPRARRRPDAVQQRGDDADADALLDRQDEIAATVSDDEQRIRRGCAAKRRPSPRRGRCAARRTAARRRAPHAAHGRAGCRRTAASASASAAATSPADCETPPVSATIAVRGGLALTGKAPAKPASSVGDADAEKIPVDVGAAGGVGDKAAGGRRRLHHDDERDDERERRDRRENRRRTRSAARSVRPPPEMSPSGATPFPSSPSRPRGSRSRRQRQSARRECGD